MGASFTFLRLEIKRALKILPYFLAGAIVLAVLLGTIAFSASKVLYGEEKSGRITVGVVLPEGDKLAKQVVSMLGSMDSVKSICDFKYVDAKSGKKQLKTGDIYALMEIPEGFVKGILDGTNTPVTVTLPDQAGLETLMFKELTSSGARILSVAQAAIYAADEFAGLNGLSDSIPQIEKKLNEIYLAYSLPRDRYFKQYPVSAAGDVSTTVYYGISLSVLFLLLCGIPASTVLRPSSFIFQKKLKTIGIGRFKIVASRLAAVSLLLITVALPLALYLQMTGLLMIGGAGFFVLFLLCLTAAAVIMFFYEAAGSALAGVMLTFLASVGMVFLSGGFIPSVFLPEGVRALSYFMPTTLMIQVMKGMVTETVSISLTAALAAMAAGFYLAAVCVRRKDG